MIHCVDSKNVHRPTSTCTCIASSSANVSKSSRKLIDRRPNLRIDQNSPYARALGNNRLDVGKTNLQFQSSSKNRNDDRSSRCLVHLTLEILENRRSLLSTNYCLKV